MIQGPYSKSFNEMSQAERDVLLIEHLPVVRYVALQLYRKLPHHLDPDDLVSAGVVGLIDAFSKFDHVRNVEFKSYAQFRIRGAILDSLRALDWSPSDLRRKGRAAAEAARALSQRDGHVPLEHEIADEMQVSLADYQTLLRDLRGLEITSLHRKRFSDTMDEELESIPDVTEESPLSLYLKSELERRLKDDLQELPEKERLVVKMYYFDELTMKQIGTVLGVAEARISQIHSSAVHKLRSALREFKPSMLTGTGRIPRGATQYSVPVQASRRCKNTHQPQSASQIH
jgi:RNA polymerase sigma factor for flagellar operon FliA